MRWIVINLTALVGYPNGAWALIDTQPSSGSDRIVAVFEDNASAVQVQGLLNDLET